MIRSKLMYFSMAAAFLGLSLIGILDFLFPKLFLPASVASLCIILITMVMICSYLSQYRKLQMNMENRKMLLGRPGSMASFQSAKKDMERFKKNTPRILVRIVEFLAN